MKLKKKIIFFVVSTGMLFSGIFMFNEAKTKEENASVEKKSLLMLVRNSNTKILKI